MQVKVLTASTAKPNTTHEMVEKAVLAANPLWFEMESLPRVGDTVWVAGVFGTVTGLQWEKSDEVGGVPRLVPCITVVIP